MGRRKKAPPNVHREAIANAAEKLFLEKGIPETTMDDIASAAHYSKATLYVYFANKEELVGFLTLRSMELLYQSIHQARLSASNTKERYLGICHTLVQYYEKYPFYFEMALGEINVDFQKPDTLEVERVTYAVGERINQEVSQILTDGIREGALREDLPIPQTIFACWGSLSGLIQLAAKKSAYLSTSLHLSPQSLLDYGFELIYLGIERR